MCSGASFKRPITSFRFSGASSRYLISRYKPPFARSSVFEKMFSSDMEESRTNRVTIKTLEPDIVKKMIHYIYTDTVEGLEDDAEDLLPAADMYDLPGLKTMCEDVMIEKMDLDTAQDLLLKADMYKAAKLKEKAMEYIVECRKEFISQEDWKEKFANNPTVLADLFEAMAKTLCKDCKTEVTLSSNYPSLS